MKKSIWTCLGLVGAVLLAAAGSFLTAPEEAIARVYEEAESACDCTTNPLQSTPMVWGEGPDCSSAFNDALAQSRALQNCPDGVCFEQVIIDAACWWDEVDQMYMVDLHTDFRCYFCTSAPPPCCNEPLPQEPVPQDDDVTMF